MKIHYNVTGADRKALVKVIADTAGARAVYKGMPSAAYEIDYYTVTKDGTLEFSDRSDSEEVEAVLEALAAAGFDGVGETEKQTEGTNETPETPTAADTEPQESEEQEPVQLTVSLPLARHTGMSLRNLINLLYTRAPLVNKALGTAFRVDERLVNVLRDDANVLTMERFFETVTNVENAIGKAVDGLIFAADRLTFSTLPETSDTATLRCFATLCAMMNKQAITQQRIQAKEITAENEKYAMRIWLLRLGMNGPEYKEERRILMENLSGHAAFRTEEDKVRWQARQNEKRDALRAAKQMEVTDDADAE
jgi:hypothetical protein